MEGFLIVYVPLAPLILFVLAKASSKKCKSRFDTQLLTGGYSKLRFKAVYCIKLLSNKKILNYLKSLPLPCYYIYRAYSFYKISASIVPKWFKQLFMMVLPHTHFLLSKVASMSRRSSVSQLNLLPFLCYNQ